MEVNYEQMLEHSNRNAHYIKSEIGRKSSSVLNWKENSKKWSVLEVLDHLTKVYELYEPNFKSVIEQSPESNGESSPMQRTLLGRLSIYSQKPKGQKVRFKMNTFSFFQPENHDKLEDAIQTYLDKKEYFNELIKSARKKNLAGRKIPTALGEKVKFYIPECFQFLLAHEDRHLVQIQNILKAAK
ncbi:MAG: DinB family protein [Ekhidna sp.]|nr:DinB family protein [Ekhidna sp.]